MLFPDKLKSNPVQRIIPVKLQPFAGRRVHQKPRSSAVFAFVGRHEQREKLPHDTFADELRTLESSFNLYLIRLIRMLQPKAGRRLAVSLGQSDPPGVGELPNGPLERA